MSKTYILFIFLYSCLYADNNPFKLDFQEIRENEYAFIYMIQKEKQAQERMAEKARKQEQQKYIEKETEKKRLALIEKKKKEELAGRHILAVVDISKQKMKVYRGKKLLHIWKVSTGKRGYSTPKGKYQPQYATKMHYSKQYNNAPMPYSVFFRNGYAVHGTKSISRLGRRASHGCVRLQRSHAKTFYTLIKQSGIKNAEIKIVR